MTTATRTRKPATKPARFLSLTPAAAGPGQLLTLRVGKDVDAYDLAEIPADDAGARGFQLAKLSIVEKDLADGDTYHVLLNGTKRGTCDCKGFTRHGRCKHSASLLKLVELGKL